MKTQGIRAWIVAMVGVAGMSAADPAERLPPAAAWAVHVDMARLAASPVGDRLRARLAEPDAAPRIEAFHAVFRFDPRTDLQSVTVYGASSREEDAVAVVRGEFDAGHIATVLQGQRGHRVLDGNGHRVHAWVERMGAAFGGPREFFGAFPSEQTFVFGRDLPAVTGMLSTLAGEAPLSAVPEGAFLAAVVDTARLPSGRASQAAVLRYARIVAMELGEESGILRARLRLTADTEEIAGNLESVVDGMLSMLLLQADLNPEWAALARGAEVRRTGHVVGVGIVLPVETVERMVRRRFAPVQP